MLLPAEGAVDGQAALLLRLCVDALRATAVLPAQDLARLSSAVDTVSGLANVQDDMRKVQTVMPKHNRCCSHQ